MLVYHGTLSSALGVTVADQSAVMILPTSINLGEPIMFFYQLLVPAPPLSPIVGNLGRIDTISTTTIFNGSASFGFLHGIHNFWQFDATYTEQDASLTQSPLSITLVVTKGGNQSPGMVFGRVFNDPDFTRIAFAAVPHIYVGQLTWPKLNALGEMFIVIIPESIDIGKPICVHWQWTTPQGISQVNYEGKIVSAKGTQNAIVITFSYLDYTFTGSIDETNKTISVTMSDTSGNESQPPFLLSDKFQVSFDPVDGRAKRSAIATTSTVLNNSTDVIFCEVSSSSEPLVGKIMASLGSLVAVGGAVSAGAGLLTGATAVALANPPGAAVIAGVGLLLAIASVADVLPWFDPEAPQSQVLFPGESLVRTSSGGAGASNNNVLAVKAKIQGNDLVILMAQKSAIGGGTCELENLFPPGGTSVTELLRISLRALQAALSPCQHDVAGDTPPVPKPLKLNFYRLIAVEGLQPLWDSQQGQPTTQSDVVGSVFSPSTPQLNDIDTLKWYGSFTGAEKAQNIFSCSPSTAFTVFTQTMVSTAGVAYEIKQTPGGNLVLRLGGCGFDFTCVGGVCVDEEAYNFPLSNFDLQNSEPVGQILSLIDNYQAYWAFSSSPGQEAVQSKSTGRGGPQSKVMRPVTKVTGLNNGAFRIKKGLKGSIYFLIKRKPQIVQFLGY